MDTNKIIQLSNKIKSKLNSVGLNEEQTKTAFIMPFFIALGYDVFDDTEFIPEYTADFGVKQGEKVDYAICINGQPIALVECKKLGTQLHSDHVSQLFRYYASTDAKIGILTNGDDYWFFADSIKKNQMDKEPYLRIKLSNIDNKAIASLECYDRENIDKINILEDVQSQRFRIQASEFISRIHSGNLPSDFIEFLANRFSIADLDKSKLAAIFNESYGQIVLGKPEDKVETVTVTVNNFDKFDQKSGHGKWNRCKATDLPIGVPISFNLGNLAFHKPSTLIIKDTEYQISSLAEMMTNTVSYIINTILHNDKTKVGKFKDSLAERPLGIKLYESMEDALNDNTRGIRCVPDTKLLISTAFDAKTMQSIMEKAINLVGIPTEDVKIILLK